MLNRYHDLEVYYLQRRIELLQVLDQFANEAFEDEDYSIDDDHWKIQMLKQEYSDVIDPANLCSTLRKLYPDHLFQIKSSSCTTK